MRFGVIMIHLNILAQLNNRTLFFLAQRELEGFWSAVLRGRTFL